MMHCLTNTVCISCEKALLVCNIYLCVASHALYSGVFTIGPLGPYLPLWAVDRKCNKFKSHTLAIIGLGLHLGQQNE